MSETQIVEKPGPPRSGWPLFQRLGLFSESVTVDDLANRRIHSVISTERKSRTRLVIHQDGWDLEEYLKNPVVLFDHRWDQPPVAMNVALDLKKKALHAITEFAPSVFGEELFSLYAGGYMRSWSVGIDPRKIEEEYDKNGNFVALHSLEHGLMEYSAVPIPANPDAVTQAMQQGVIREKATGDYLRLAALSGHDSSLADTATLEETENSIDRLGLLMRVEELHQLVKKKG